MAQLEKALLTPDNDNVSQWNEIEDDGEHGEDKDCQPAQEWDSPVECTRRKINRSQNCGHPTEPVEEQIMGRTGREVTSSISENKLKLQMNVFLSPQMYSDRQPRLPS